MLGDPFQKVNSGDRLRIPAVAYNSFVDAAADLRNRQRSQSSAAIPPDVRPGIVLVRNDSGRNLDQFNVVGLGGIIIAPTDNEREFRTHVVMSGAVPDSTKHRGKFAVLAEPIAADKFGLAYVDAICQVKLNVPAGAVECPFAEILDGETAHLAMAGHGSARILWREDGTGVKWAVVRIGPPPAMFPVALEQTGGAHGDENASASWTYTVKDIFTGDTLKPDVNPGEAPHKFKRPAVGWMTAATFGYAHFDGDGALVVGWVNEVPEQEVCDTAGSGS